MSYLLGIDIGTSGVKTLLCDPRGGVCATASADLDLSSPRPGWSEQDPRQWWSATVKATRAVLSKAKVRATQVRAIGLSGQMHGSVFLDAAGRPLRPALLWNDQRTAAECAEIEHKAGGRRKLIALVGNPALTGFTAPKILWFRRHQKRLYDKTRHILLPKDYIRFCMTGEYATEVGDASGTLLFDVKKRIWNTHLMRLLEIDPALLPSCHESHVVTGRLTGAVAAELNLALGTPVVGGSGDQPAGAVGNGIVTSGIASATLGTSGVVFAHADKPIYDPLGRVHTMCSAVAGKWCVFGCMLSAGGSFQWFRNHLAREEVVQARRAKVDPYDLLIAQAAGAPPALPHGRALPLSQPQRPRGLDRPDRPARPARHDPRLARRRDLRHGRRVADHGRHGPGHRRGPPLGRRGPRPVLAPAPGRHLPPACRRHQLPGRPGLGRGDPRRRRHRRLEGRPRSLRRGDP